MPAKKKGQEGLHAGRCRSGRAAGWTACLRPTESAGCSGPPNYAGLSGPQLFPSMPSFRVLITDRSPTANHACHSSNIGADTSDFDSYVAAFALQSRQAACYQSHRPGGLLAERFLGGAVLGLPLSTLGALGRPSTRYAPLGLPPRRDTTNRVDERFRSALRY